MEKEQLALTRSRGPALSIVEGFTLLEVIVAIFVMAIGIGGVFGFLQQTIFLGPILGNQLMASYLAQEGVEIVRNIRDTNYVRIAGGGAGTWTDGGLATCSGGCEADYNDLSLASAGSPLQFLKVVSDVSGTRYQYGASGTSTPFQRKITVTPSGAPINVKVEVLWQEKGNSRSFVVDTFLYNWAGF